VYKCQEAVGEIDNAFFAFQRRLGLHEKTTRLRSSSLLGSRLLHAATVLVLAALLTPVACLVIGFARYAARRRLDEMSRYARATDGGLSYERVDSVSSIVDSRRHDLHHHQLYQDVVSIDVEEMTVI